jgi:guanylate kinase
MTESGILFIVSAPSGAGKRTVLAHVQSRHPFVHTISATTRAPRPGEKPGVDYHFLTHEDFIRRRDEGGFVEWAEVHGHLYGTLREELERCVAAGKDVVLELDVQGMRSVKRQFSDSVSVFLLPPSWEELERRLKHRGTDDPQTIALRLRNAHAELAACKEYDYIVVNDRLEQAVEDVAAIFQAEHCRSHRVKHSLVYETESTKEG